ncbi:MAG TPA: hypothetical protein VF531_02205 [Bacillota bacterium]
MNEKPVLAFVFSLFIVILTAAVTYMGLFIPEIYGDRATELVLSLQARDTVLLILVVPLLLVTACLALRKSRRAYLAWLGILAYLSYTYAGYSFGLANNPLFLIYVIIFSLSLFSLVLNLNRLNIEAVPRWFSPKTPVGGVALWTTVSGLTVGAIWLRQVLPGLINVQNTRILTLGVDPGLAIPALDLGLVAPLAVFTGIWLWKRRAWGYTFACLILFQTIAIGLNHLSYEWWLSQRGTVSDSVQLLIYGGLVMIPLLLVITFLRNLREEILKNNSDRSTVSYF